MNLKKRIFKARITGEPIELKQSFYHLRPSTRLVNRLLKYKVMRIDTSQPHNIGLDEAVFRLNDSVSSNGAVYSVGQRILFSSLNINGIVQVAEDR